MLTSRPNLPGTNSIFNQYFFFSLSDFPLFSLSASDRWIQTLKLILFANFSLNCAPAACLYQHSILFLFLRFSLCASDSWCHDHETIVLSNWASVACQIQSIFFLHFFSFYSFILVQVTAGVKLSNLKSQENCSINCASAACHIFSFSVFTCFP